MKHLSKFVVVFLGLFVLWFVGWNKLEELMFSGDGKYTASSADLGPLLTTYKLVYPSVDLRQPASYQYRFTRFSSNNRVWVEVKFHELKLEDIQNLPSITLIIKENGEDIFVREGRLEHYESSKSQLSNVKMGLKKLGQSYINVDWSGEYTVDIIVHDDSRLDEEMLASIELVSSWK